MSLADLGPHFLALLLYPGALLTLAFGVVAEAAAGLLFARRRDPAGALLAPLLALRRTALEAPNLLVAALLLAVLAATQLAAPLSPVPPVERNLVVAVVAAASAAWLGRARGWSTAEARRALVAQVCWLVALLTPALLSESLRPQALGAVMVPAALPLKVASALLALLCLPALLPFGPGRDELRPVRPLLWLPLCGLFASAFFPPGGDDLPGLLWFLGATTGTAAASIGLALLAARQPRLYPRLLAPLTVAVLALAAITSAAT